MRGDAMLKKTLLLGAALIGVSISNGQNQTAPLLPDLAIDEARVQSSLYFEIRNFSRNDCAVVEGLLTGSGKRTLMRFDVAAANQGTKDLFLGDPTQRPELFTYSPCHKHYHFNGYASYELLDDNGRTKVTLVKGRKQAFCLEDFEVVSPAAGPAKYTCSYQGISVGWADTYGAYLDGQWLDITGVSPAAPGHQYYLRVIINPFNVRDSGYFDSNAPAAQAMQELDYSNNAALVPVTIPLRFK